MQYEYLIWFTVSASPGIKVKFSDAYAMCRSTMMCRVGLKLLPPAVSCHSLCQQTSPMHTKHATLFWLGFCKAATQHGWIGYGYRVLQSDMSWFPASYNLKIHKYFKCTLIVALFSDMPEMGSGFLRLYS